MKEDNLIKSTACTYWFTGLPCSGKSTLADRLKEIYLSYNQPVVRLDGDVVRKSLCNDLGFSYEDRKENLRRVASVAEIVNSQNIPVLASFVSPTEELRGYVAEIIGEDKFKLIYVKCSLEECERRDVKGMYALARKGKIKGFTGVDDVFEEPEKYDLIVDTEKNSIEKCVSMIADYFNLFGKQNT